MVFIAPNGKLYYESKTFVKASINIDGIKVTELWCDSYQMNIEKGGEVLFPADFNCPFPVTEHVYGKESEFIKKGGGFRLDFIIN